MWAKADFQSHIDRMLKLVSVKLQMFAFDANLECCWHIGFPPLFRRFRNFEVGWGDGEARDV